MVLIRNLYLHTKLTIDLNERNVALCYILVLDDRDLITYFGNSAAIVEMSHNS